MSGPATEKQQSAEPDDIRSLLTDSSLTKRGRGILAAGMSSSKLEAGVIRELASLASCGPELSRVVAYTMDNQINLVSESMFACPVERIIGALPAHEARGERAVRWRRMGFGFCALLKPLSCCLKR